MSHREAVKSPIRESNKQAMHATSVVLVAGSAGVPPAVAGVPPATSFL
jgi:hypothetical protein